MSIHNENILLVAPYKFLNETDNIEDTFLGLFLKAKLGSDVPNLDGCGDLKVWGELIDLALDPDEYFEDSELLLFFEDCPNKNPKLFLF